MKARKTKADRIREYLQKYPAADVAKVAEKFETAKPVVYKLRKEVQEANVAKMEEGPITETWTLTTEPGVGTVETGAETGPSEGEIEQVLRERGDRYGPFENHAKITQMLKDVMRSEPGWGRLTYPQREALEMVAHKIGRMLNGDPTYEDSVVDIIGYTDLMLRCMRGKNEL